MIGPEEQSKSEFADYRDECDFCGRTRIFGLSGGLGPGTKLIATPTPETMALHEDCFEQGSL